MRYCYLKCLHNLPGYRAELLSATAQHDAEKAELQQDLLHQLEMHEKQLAALHSKHQQELDSDTDQLRQMLREQEQRHQAAMHACREAADALVSKAERQSSSATAAANAACRSQQDAMASMQKERKQLDSDLLALQQEKAALLAEGTSNMQRLIRRERDVIALREAYTTLQQVKEEAQQQADQQMKNLQYLVQRVMEDQQQAEADAEDAPALRTEANKLRSDIAKLQQEITELYPTHVAEVTSHSRLTNVCAH